MKPLFFANKAEYYFLFPELTLNQQSILKCKFLINTLFSRILNQISLSQIDNVFTDHAGIYHGNAISYANSLKIKYIFHKNTLNPPFFLHPEFHFLRIHYRFCKFTMNSIIISRIDYQLTIFSAKLLYVHYLFREFTIN